jgi:hypothetical protein
MARLSKRFVVMGFFEAAFLCAVALVMITAIQMDG